jgi:hypothetical protein
MVGREEQVAGDRRGIRSGFLCESDRIGQSDSVDEVKNPALSQKTRQERGTVAAVIRRLPFNLGPVTWFLTL